MVGPPAELDAAAPPAGTSTARIENRPMWLVCQTAPKLPSGATVACTVGSQAQRVLGPERSISSTSPASRCGAVPENLKPLRSTAEARAAIVIPSPLAVTITSPGWVLALPPDCGLTLGDAPPLGPTEAPGEDASPAVGIRAAIVPAQTAALKRILA